MKKAECKTYSIGLLKKAFLPIRATFHLTFVSGFSATTDTVPVKMIVKSQPPLSRLLKSENKKKTYMIVINMSTREVAIEGSKTIRTSCVKGLVGSHAVTSHSSAMIAPLLLTKHQGFSYFA